MSAYQRKSAVVCQELSEAAIEARRFEERILSIIEDGIVTDQERADLIAGWRDFRREMDEAIYVAEDNDLTEARYEHDRRVPTGTPYNQRIMQKAAGVEALRQQVQRAVAAQGSGSGGQGRGRGRGGLRLVGRASKDRLHLEAKAVRKSSDGKPKDITHSSTDERVV